MIDDQKLKKAVAKVARSFDDVFEDTHIDQFKVENDKVCFYEKKQLVFTLPVSEVLND